MKRYTPTLFAVVVASFAVIAIVPAPVTSAAMNPLPSLLPVATPATGWMQFEGRFSVPVGYTSAVVYHALTSVGSPSTDNYSVAESSAATLAPVLTKPATATPPAPALPPANAFSQALVSLTFDDGWKSIYTNGLPLLTKHGIVSTQYLLSGTRGSTEYMTIEEMRAFQSSGSEIAAHTVNHCDLTGQQTDNADTCPIPTNPTKIRNELANNKSDLETIFGVPVNNFASPYGSYNNDIIAATKAAGYTSHRSADEGYNSLAGFNPYNIKVQNILNTTTPGQVQAWVNEAIVTKTWLVLVYHEVNDNNDRYSVTPANLDTELAAIKASGVNVVTVDQALAELTPQVPVR